MILNIHIYNYREIRKKRFTILSKHTFDHGHNTASTKNVKYTESDSKYLIEYFEKIFNGEARKNSKPKPLIIGLKGINSLKEPFLCSIRRK